MRYLVEQLKDIQIRSVKKVKACFKFIFFQSRYRSTSYKRQEGAYKRDLTLLRKDNVLNKKKTNERTIDKIIKKTITSSYYIELLAKLPKVFKNSPGGTISVAP